MHRNASHFSTQQVAGPPPPPPSFKKKDGSAYSSRPMQKHQQLSTLIVQRDALLKLTRHRSYKCIQYAYSP